jgi:hypothetical protein
MSKASRLSQPDIAQFKGILWDDMQGLREGRTTPANARAVAGTARVILSTVRLEMEYAKLTGQTPNVPMLNGKSETAS